MYAAATAQARLIGIHASMTKGAYLTQSSVGFHMLSSSVVSTVINYTSLKHGGMGLEAFFAPY